MNRLLRALQTAGFCLVASSVAAQAPGAASVPAVETPAPAATVCAEGAVAAAQVEGFHAGLLVVMQTEDHAARATLLTPMVTACFDLAQVARISVGPAWRALTPDERARFSSLLQHLIVATYADRFDSYNEQRFETLATAEASTGPVVQTRLLRKTGEPVRLDYYFRRGLIFNVVADGVSDLALRRAEYSSIVRAEGFDALIAHMQASIAEMETEDAEDEG